MQIPEKIGRYEVERVLGHGGMAVVFLARDPLIHRPVAIKVLPRQLTFTGDLRERFYREARIIAGLEHPAIVPIHDFGEHDEQPYLVMRYMAGGSLRQKVSKPLSLAETERILSRLAPALDKAHTKGIIHRDIKPDNVLFDEEGMAYLADFGVARLTEATKTMTRTGTPTYISPEQIQGDQSLDARTDIYALGVVLYEMLAGGPPFQADTPPKLYFMHVYEPVPDIHIKMPDLPAGLQAIIEKAMAKEPAGRYASAVELAQALQTMLPTPEERTGSPLAASPALLSTTITEVETPEVPPAPHPAVARQDKKARQLVPVWGYALAGALFLVLLLWGGGQLVGGIRSKETTEATRPVEEVSSVVVASAIETPTPTRGLPGLTITQSGDTLTTTSSPTPSSTLSRTPSPTPTASLSAPVVEAELGDRLIRPADGMEMAFVPAGSFFMGTIENDPDADNDEFPQHQVTLDAFWLDKTEVTNEQFAIFLNEHGNQEEGGVSWLDIGGGSELIESVGNQFRSVNGYGDHPVIEVSWFGAAAYCGWAAGRLPTEAEWEYANRGPEGNRFPWGNNDPTCSLTQYSICAGQTVAVGSIPAGASWTGVLDMAGNVWEWVNDWYDRIYYSNSPPSNPFGPLPQEEKVIRGGGWNIDLNKYLRGAFRDHEPPTSRSDNVGFRCMVPNAN